MTTPACRVIAGDVLNVLPTLPDASVDAVITDPPYSSGAATLAGKQAPVAKKYQNTGTLKSYPAFFGDQRDQRSFTYWITLWLAQCWRIARDKAPLLVFTDWRQLPAFTDAVQAAGWAWRGVVVWRKPGARPVLGEFRREAEFIVYARKGGYAGKSGDPCLPGVYSYPVVGAKKQHMTEKPLPLMYDLMQIVSAGGTVLDPFCGSGTTLAAAMISGRGGIGVELSAEYCRITENRLAAIAAERARALPGVLPMAAGGEA